MLQHQMISSACAIIAMLYFENKSKAMFHNNKEIHIFRALLSCITSKFTNDIGTQQHAPNNAFYVDKIDHP